MNQWPFAVIIVTLIVTTALALLIGLGKIQVRFKPKSIKITFKGVILDFWDEEQPQLRKGKRELLSSPSTGSTHKRSISTRTERNKRV